jgi:CHASE1-domain containing sensor protein
MLILGSALFGILIFLAILLVTIVLGAVAQSREKDEQLRIEVERTAGLSGDVTDTPHPIHDRYLET